MTEEGIERYRRYPIALFDVEKANRNEEWGLEDDNPWLRNSPILTHVIEKGDKTSRIVSLYDENDVEDWHQAYARDSEIPNEYLKFMICESCGGKEVYHDKKQKWVCPFCKLKP